MRQHVITLVLAAAVSASTGLALTGYDDRENRHHASSDRDNR